MIAYKVVEKGTRHGTNWVLFKSSVNCRITNQTICKSIIKSRRRRIMRKAPHLFPRYLKNSCVIASSKTPGIFCFVDYQSAECFIDYHHEPLKNCIIVKVEGIGKPRLDFKLITQCGDPDNLLNKEGDIVSVFDTVYYKRGVKMVVFPEVKVLE